MPNIFHQSVEDILKAATPEQRLLWNYIFLRWGERISISQLCFSGASAASELIVYSANRIYLAYHIDIPGISTAIVTSNLQLYNEANVSKGIYNNSLPYWDATAAAVRYGSAALILKNVWFSRFAANVASDVNFIGYRIGI